MNRFRLASSASAFAAFIGWVSPAAAIDLTSYIPFQAELTCTGTPCENILSLPVNRQTVLEYVSFGCNNIALGAKVSSVFVTTTVNGVQVQHNLELPVAASLGDAPSGVAAAGQVVRIYADPNSKISVEAYVAGASSALGCGFGFSGEQSPALPP